jgi:hypothetical protein
MEAVSVLKVLLITMEFVLNVLLALFGVHHQADVW